MKPAPTMANSHPAHTPLPRRLCRRAYGEPRRYGRRPRAITSVSVAPAAARRRCGRVMHHHDAVGDAQHLRQLARAPSGCRRPAPSARAISACSSDLAPTSTPRVGSSSKQHPRARVASHLPITTFCWLPPESSTVVLARMGRAHAERGDQAGGLGRQAPAGRPGRARLRPDPDQGDDCRCTGSGADEAFQMPVLRDTDDARPLGAARRLPGAAASRRRPAPRPAVGLDRPAMQRITSDRPLPIRPASATTSPACTVEVWPRAAARHRKCPGPPTSRSPRLRSRWRKTLPMSRPTIIPISAGSSRSRIARSPTKRPSRSTTARSARVKISSILCEM